MIGAVQGHGATGLRRPHPHPHPTHFPADLPSLCVRGGLFAGGSRGRTMLVSGRDACACRGAGAGTGAGTGAGAGAVRTRGRAIAYEGRSDPGRIHNLIRRCVTSIKGGGRGGGAVERGRAARWSDC